MSNQIDSAAGEDWTLMVQMDVRMGTVDVVDARFCTGSILIETRLGQERRKQTLALHHISEQRLYPDDPRYR